ncbi:hypothetical protein P3T73_13040 [Kiritimatiellota bacterium B12222]|nr:hypothetical protein P3T73_13040 [Kiritimatiellota bacterium B12222]
MKDKHHSFESQLSKLFAMSDATWERHAHPWSVWTLFTVLPVLIIAIWSRVWLGGWAWGLVVLAVFWTWINPRMFRKPISTDHWASKAVLGERVWMNRKQVPVPPCHRIAPNVLSGVTGIGVLFLIWGLWKLNVWSTVTGSVLIYAGKVWFLDRMVWLYEDMKNANPEYSRWLPHESTEQTPAGENLKERPEEDC